MNNQLRTAETIESTTYEAVANFTNGFAQNVIELEDGTVLYINYSGTEVTIEKRQLEEEA